jgi:hypothetical protein
MLLPLDTLALPGAYLAAPPADVATGPIDRSQADQVFQYEPMRWYTAAEIRAGRLPMWSPFSYAGAPAGGVQWSPFQVWYVLWPSPHCLPWIQVAVALVAGFGVYRSCRDVFGVRFWPAAVAAWACPLTGPFILWQGHAIPHSAAWLGWIVWATDLAVRRPGGPGGPLLAAFVALSIGSGMFDIAGQCLLVSGLVVGWRLLETVVATGRLPRLKAVLAPACGWGLGLGVCAIIFIPLFAYLPTGARYQARTDGVEERPPVGLEAAVPIVAPHWNGTRRDGSCFLTDGNLPESAAAGYAGLVAAAALAPLAFLDRSRRSAAWFLACVAIVAASWQLALPGFVQVFRLPLLNSLSYNRFVFATAWAVTTLAAIGLDESARGRSVPGRWAAVGGGLSLLAAGVFAAHALGLRAGAFAAIENVLRAGSAFGDVETLAELATVKTWFFRADAWAACMAAGSAILWLLLARGRGRMARLAPLIAAAAWLGELATFAAPTPLLSDPRLYYPAIPIFERLAAAPPGRVLGISCLPPRLGERYGFRDVRGYDAVDPAALVALLELVKDENAPSLSYARTQWYVPVMFTPQNGVPRLPGVLNMLNLRYLIFRGSPPDGSRLPALMAGDGYWVWENPAALPRAFVPQRVSACGSQAAMLERLADKTFDAAVESFTENGPTFSACSGDAQVVREHPQEVVIEAEMATPGLVVLADQWYDGWKATVNGSPAAIHVVNHALRGVEAPAGRSTIVMQYAPATVARGMRWSSVALVCLAGWAVASGIRPMMGRRS